MWKNTVDLNMAHAHVRPDNYDNNHLLKICNFLLSHDENRYANAIQFYVIRTLSC